MAVDAVSDYMNARESLEQIEEETNRMVQRLLSDLNLLVDGKWKQIMFDNHGSEGDFPPELVLRGPGLSIDVARSPSMKDVASMAAKYHKARRSTTAAWDRLSETQQDELPRPIP